MANDDKQAASSLMRAFGLSETDFESFGKVFATVLDSTGLDGSAILAKLSGGADPREALGLPDGTVEVLYARAHRWLTVGRTDRAEPLFRALTVLDGGSADHWLGLGICHRLQDRAPEARKAFGAAARLRPDWAVPHFHLAELALHARRPDDARKALERFDRLRDDETPAQLRVQAERYRVILDGIDAATPIPER